MTLIKLKAEHLMSIQAQDAQRGIATSFSLAHALEIEDQFSFSVVHDGAILACGGCVPLWEGRAQAWAILSPMAKYHMRTVHKNALEMLKLAPWPRLEADTPYWFHEGKRWLLMLGFKIEAPKAEKYYSNGDDAILFSRVK